MVKALPLLGFLLPAIVLFGTSRSDTRVNAQAPQVLSGGFNDMCSPTATEGNVCGRRAKARSGVPTSAAAGSLPYPIARL